MKKLLLICSLGLSAGLAASDLSFNADRGKKGEITVNGEKVPYRAFENISYLSKPVEPDYQTMHIYIPEAYFADETSNGYDKNTAPIFFPNAIGGYLAAKAQKIDESRGGEASAAQLALAKGYVVAAVGARGRNLKRDDLFTGKAPAAIIDLKAAVRYLHKNDGQMPGDANRIIANGTSAGGALSLLLGVSGDSPDYREELAQVGAANASDKIFAVSAYCPITNLENADSAYEWQFNGLNEYERPDFSQMNSGSYNRRGGKIPTVSGTLSASQQRLSTELKNLFPTYLNGLKLKSPEGSPLTLKDDGSGLFRDYLASKVVEGATRAKAVDVNYLIYAQGKPVALDWDKYIASEKRQKTPPAFDAGDLSTGENDLFGSATVAKRHFSGRYRHVPMAQHDLLRLMHSASLNAGKIRDLPRALEKLQTPPLAEAATVKLMNPMNYIGGGADHYRLRVGARDRDTSLAISAIAALKLQEAGKQVDYFVPWNVGHGGDYDLEELFQWTEGLFKPTPTGK